jgi:aldose 1-epimerase
MAEHLVPLEHGHWRLAIWPELGGSLVSADYRLDGAWVRATQPVNEAALARRHPSWLGCYPLLPWCNRLDGGRFRFNDREVQVPINRPELNLAIHGFGCFRPWRVSDVGQNSVALAQTFREVGNPYAYEAMLSYRIEDESLIIDLAVENAGEEPLPFGIGLHPFFRRTPATVAQFVTGGSLENDERKLPTRFVDCAHGPDAGTGLPAASLLGVDRGFVGWDGNATLDWREEGRRLRLMSSPTLRLLHLFVPADDRQAICLEPVSHVIDVVNRRELATLGDMTVLHPGERLSGWMRVGVERN